MLYLLRHANNLTSSPTLVFIHGFLGGGRDWQELASILPTQVNVAAITLPGHIDPRGNLVPLPRQLTFSSLTTAIADSLLKNLPTPIILLGYSLGGRVAMHLASRYPELLQHLVVISAHPGLVDKRERDVRYASDLEIAKRLEEEGLSQFLSWWYSQAIFSSLARQPEILAKVIANRQDQNPASLARILRELSTGIMEPLWSKLPTLGVPVTYIAGALDTKYTSLLKRAHEVTPNSNLCVIPGAGHAPHLEEGAVVRKMLELIIELLPLAH